MLTSIVLAVLFAQANSEAPIWSPGGCGQSKYADAGSYPVPAISGGIQNRPYEFPWMVSLRDSAGNHFCGGAIIADIWVLTSASCIQDLAAGQVTIVAGEYNSSEVSVVRQAIPAAAIYQNSAYNNQTMQSNIAMVKASTPIAFSADVQPVCAPDPDDQQQYIGQPSQMSGWGSFDNVMPCCSDVPFYTTTPVATNIWCDAKYPLISTTPDMICADNSQDTNRDMCQGDMGGPLTYKDSRHGIFSLLGVASFSGPDGCDTGYPPVFARVGYFTAWIAAIIDSGKDV